jgi:hypothetical protein
MALDNEDDNWEEEIKRSLRYEIRLLIKHPDMDPARITEELRLKPNLSHLVGNPRMTKANPTTWCV